jgi:hypothetical protein
MLILLEGKIGKASEPSKKPCSFRNQGAMDRKELPLLVSKGKSLKLKYGICLKYV